MTDVACFCGCCYSFVGDVGVCPGCGEYAGLTGVSALEEPGARPVRHLPQRAARSPLADTGASQGNRFLNSGQFDTHRRTANAEQVERARHHPFECMLELDLDGTMAPDDTRPRR